MYSFFTNYMAVSTGTEALENESDILPLFYVHRFCQSLINEEHPQHPNKYTYIYTWTTLVRFLGFYAII
jgi:hypothetical protein